MARQIPKSLQDKVRTRANELCEYCHTNERWQYIPFTVDHIIPLSKGGITSFDNLALTCFHCNRRKSDKTTIFAETANKNVALFNPRIQLWREHFRWSDDYLSIIPLTEIGRVTVHTLSLNRKRLQLIRAEDITVKRHPPREDSVPESDAL
jgi:HNH endonuclease